MLEKTAAEVGHWRHLPASETHTFDVTCISHYYAESHA